VEEAMAKERPGGGVPGLITDSRGIGSPVAIRVYYWV
jgi:hypothetical protein